MIALRTTAILKTDLRGSTPTFRGLSEVDLDAMLREHRAFVTRLAAAHDGRIGACFHISGQLSSR
jgi:class 3 adenylate cyclase